jgi:hypothetical protein
MREVQMEPQTNAANTKDWLKATKELTIRAYVETYMPTVSVRGRPSPPQAFDEALRKVSVPLPAERVPIIDPQLDIELQAWDVLSDEALKNFERELD